MLALRGTPWDAKGRLATPVPTMGGLPPPTAATASAARGSDATSTPDGGHNSTDVGPRVAPETGGAASSADQPMASGPEDLPEEGEQDVEGAELRPEKRARGRPRK
eukprot:2635002-Amphidinium_carterae.1